MRRRRWILGLAIALGCAAGSVRPAAAQPFAPTARTEVALVATPHAVDARASEVRIVSLDRSGRPTTRTLGSIVHAPGAVVRGALLPGRASVAVVAADVEGASDRDWGSALHRVDARGTKLLGSGLYHASRPLASADGLVYVERGTSGAWPSPEEAKTGRLRADALHIDAVDPESGASRTVITSTGYTLHLAGEWGSELLVYRVAFEGAALIAVDRANGRSRTLSLVPPFARDFSVDRAHAALVMSNRDEHDTRLWFVERIDLATGARTRLFAARDEAPAPFAIPGGEIAWSAPGRRGLLVSRSLDASGASPATVRSLAPLGGGFDAVVAASKDGAWIALRHVPAGGGADVTDAIDFASGAVVPLTLADERVVVIGFAGAENDGSR